MKKLLLSILMAIFTLGTFAQEKVISIQTNATPNCQNCENYFNDNVPFFKGVKEYTYNKATAQLSIIYDEKKTSPEQLRKQISNLGFNADNVAANAAVRAKLHICPTIKHHDNNCTSCSKDHCHE